MSDEWGADRVEAWRQRRPGREGRYPVFRPEDDWNVSGIAYHDGKAWMQYLWHEGDEWTLREEREIVLPPVSFEKGEDAT